MTDTTKIPTNFDDIQCIQQQCGITLDDAVELYNKCKQDVVLSIATHFDASTMSEDNQKQTRTPTQQSLDALRKMANEKDTMLNRIMKQQRPAPPNAPSPHAPPTTTSTSHTAPIQIEEIEGTVETEGTVDANVRRFQV